MLPILAVKTIAELAFAAVPIVERIIRGKGRGAEKKEAAREFILEELQNVVGATPESLPDFLNFDWVAAIGDFALLAALVDNIIDDVVALLNALSKYNRTPEGAVAASNIQLV